MKLMVTGGAGFIGSNLVRFALREGHEVINLDLLTYAGNKASLADIESSPFYRFVQGDIGDTDLVHSLLQQTEPDAIINMAAESHVDRSIDSPDIFIQTNVLGTQRLLRAALTYWEKLSATRQESFRFIQISTDEVFGSIEVGKFTENSIYAPNSPYAASKAAGDHLARAYFHTYGFPALITNCTNNYGPYQFPEKLIPLVIAKAMNGESIPVYGNGSNIRDWIHVTDHCAAVLLATTTGRAGGAYLIGADNERTNLDVVRAICDAMDRILPRPGNTARKELIHFVKDRPGHDQRYAIDATRIQSELGWHPKIDFSHGLEMTINWYLENSDWIASVAEGGYGGQRLGLRQDA